MKIGSRVMLPTPVSAGELGKFLVTYGSDKEVYCRVEDGKAVLYVVTRGEHGSGTLFASRVVPLLPEEA